MPTYDYECDACGHKFEHYQGINDEVLKKCPECKKNKLRRLLGTGAAVVFKGSGFYQPTIAAIPTRKPLRPKNLRAATQGASPKANRKPSRKANPRANPKRKRAKKNSAMAELD